MGFFSSGSLATALLLALLPGASLLSAQEALPPVQFNVPYRCVDGTSYIIHRCEPRGRGEVCFYRIEKNGQLVTEVFNIRSQLTGFMKACPVQPASSASQPPPCLREMPAVEAVKRAIQGSNPNDTLARQLAVFKLLEQVVSRMIGNRAALTPDETQVIHAYEAAAYEISQAYAKTHSPDQLKAFNQLQGRYEINPKLYRETVDKLFSPALRAEYAKVDASFETRYQAGAEADRKQAESQRTQQQTAQGNSPFVRNDPGTLAARRCVELGGSELECVGKGLMTGLFGGSSIADAITGKNPGHTGLIMTGVYQGEITFSLSFGDEAVAMNGCGTLVVQSQPYTVAKNGNRFVITVRAEPKPLVLGLGPDGRLTGPGLTDLKGRIITGYNQVWMQEYRNGSPLVLPTCGGSCGHWIQEPVYAAKTERCTIGSLRPAGPTGTAGSLVTSVLGIASGQSAEKASQDSEKDLPAPGVRMTGHYAGQGGLALEFAPQSVILDCGEAHVGRPYTVENGASQALVTVKNGTAPFTLALQPDGTLVGSGSVDVAGRVVTGSTANGIAFAPRSIRCAIGTLVPGGAPSAPAADRASPSATAVPGGGTAVLSLAAAGFPAQPGTPSPLNGLTMYLLKESFAGILAKNGIRPAAGTSVIEAWGAACDRQAPECPQAFKAVQSYIASQVKLDMEGKAKFPAMPAGTFHLFGWMLYNRHHLVWDLQVDLKPGDNGVVLDQRNAVPVN